MAEARSIPSAARKIAVDVAREHDGAAEGAHVAPGSPSVHFSVPEMELNYSKSFFDPILEDDPALRAEGHATLVAMLLQSAASPSQRLIRAHIGSVLRLVFECPFEDTRKAFARVLDEYRSRNPDEPLPTHAESPSLFISLEALAATQGEHSRGLLESIYLDRGHVGHIERLMALHPEYLETSYAAHTFLMYEQGPLPLTWRFYLAILAAARHKCHFLLRQSEEEFLNVDGDRAWLDGVDSEAVPKKLRAIQQLNALMAHQPWMVSSEHVEALVSGSDAWSISELVHALTVLASYHALCGFVWGVGVRAEADWEAYEENARTAAELAAAAAAADDDDGVAAVTQRVSEMLKSAAPAPAVVQSDASREALFARVDSAWEGGGGGGGGGGAAPVSVSASSSASSLAAAEAAGAYTDPQRYIGRYPLRHVDFNLKEHQMLRVEMYNWTDEGYPLINRLYQGVGPLLDTLFRFTRRMTDNSFGVTRDVDTQPVRHAVWVYAHRVLGICHDDYDYKNTNVFLNRPLKTYIKRTVCHPEVIRAEDFARIGFDFRTEEKCHVNLLAVEARRQGELLYALRAVADYQTALN